MKPTKILYDGGKIHYLTVLYKVVIFLTRVTYDPCQKKAKMLKIKSEIFCFFPPLSPAHRFFYLDVLVINISSECHLSPSVTFYRNFSACLLTLRSDPSASL